MHKTLVAEQGAMHTKQEVVNIPRRNVELSYKHSVHPMKFHLTKISSHRIMYISTSFCLCQENTKLKCQCQDLGGLGGSIRPPPSILEVEFKNHYFLTNLIYLFSVDQQRSAFLCLLLTEISLKQLTLYYLSATYLAPLYTHPRVETDQVCGEK